MSDENRPETDEPEVEAHIQDEDDDEVEAHMRRSTPRADAPRAD